jgi:hypothetical protein
MAPYVKKNEKNNDAWVGLPLEWAILGISYYLYLALSKTYDYRKPHGHS